MSIKIVFKTLKVIGLSAAVLLIVAFIAIFMISGIFEKQKYLEPWQKSYSQKFDDPRIKLAANGLLSANGHNMQPWKIRLDRENPMVFYLYADSERMTNEVDPYARQLMITQGTFLEYVAEAGDASGYKTAMELFPEGSYDEQRLVESIKNKPVAKITLTKDEAKNNPFYDYMFLPDTNRSAYQMEKLTPEQIKQLESINRDNDISLKFYQDKADNEKIGGYVMEGAAIEAGVSRVMKETEAIFRPNEYKKNKYRYGFSVEGQGTSGIMKHIMQGMVTVFPSMNSGKTSADLFIKSTRTSIDNTPAYAMIITKDNSRSSQVRSGMLYSRFILAAHNIGFAMQPLSQVLEEYPEMKEPYSGVHHDYASDGGTIQMLVRLGKPTKEVPKSMRQDVMDLIRN